MKLSAFDQVAEHVAQLRKLQDARDMARYDTVNCAVSKAGDMDMHVIANLTSVSDVRRIVIRLLDETIVGVKAGLKTYGVDVDG